jgi:hypothetical protein
MGEYGIENPQLVHELGAISVQAQRRIESDRDRARLADRR